MIPEKEVRFSILGHHPRYDENENPICDECNIAQTCEFPEWRCCGICDKFIGVCCYKIHKH